MLLSLFNDVPAGASNSHFLRIQNERVLERLRTLDLTLRREGTVQPGACDPQLVSLGLEIDDAGSAVYNGYGPFSLGWQTAQHPVWATSVAAEAERLRCEIRMANRVPLRFVFWAGGECAVEDQHVYQAAGLLRRGPKSYVLDSTDPAKLKSILDDIERRHGLAAAAALRSTVAIGIATGTDCPESLVNVEKLAGLYEKYGIDSRRNFLLIALPGSQLECFGRERGFMVRGLAVDGADSASYRHSGPLTQGSLLSLALGKADLKSWITGTVLTDRQIHTAWQLACFIHAQGEAGRDKLTLLLPKPWNVAALWAKREFENRLGGLKIVIGERIKLANYRSPKDALQGRAFLAVQIKGAAGPDTRKIGLLRRSGYPVACVTFPRGSQLSSFMQFVHWTVFALAYLRDASLVCRCGKGLYRDYAERIFAQAAEQGGVQKTAAWEAAMRSPHRVVFSDSLTLHYGRLCAAIEDDGLSAPKLYAAVIRNLTREGRLEYGEFTFFGDTRYTRQGAALRKLTQRAAEDLFGARLKMPVDVSEGPPARGEGKCLSTLLISEKQEHLPAARYSADHHVAQFLGTQCALAEQNRPVVAIALKDLEQPALDSLGDFFRRTGTALRTTRL